MMPQIGQAAEKPPDPCDPRELADMARAALAQAGPSRESLLRRAASGDGNARVLLAEMVVLRDLAAKIDAAWFAATVSAERELLQLARENARLRADLEEARRPARRGRHAGERPAWLRSVRPAAPLAVLPAGLRHAGSLLGHHAAAKAVIGSSAVAASAVLVIGAGVAQTVPYETPAPAGHAAFRAPAAPYSAVRIPSGTPAQSPGARTAAQSASPAPVAVPSPRASSAPPAAPSPSPPVPVPAPALDVPRLLDLGAVTRGPLTLSAGDDAVTWTLRATDGIMVTEAGVPVTSGTLPAGQELDLAVSAPMGAGVIYVSAGSQTWAVVVSSDLAPAGPPPAS